MLKDKAHENEFSWKRGKPLLMAMWCHVVIQDMLQEHPRMNKDLKLHLEDVETALNETVIDIIKTTKKGFKYQT